MLQQWKLILRNWINCYFNKPSEDEQNLSIESLLSIISQLRQNLNLDESKSSVLEVNTVEEFICEKYPDFKFENGTVEAANEEEISLSASLLLFFVCVNSKNFAIKNAMCSKLSSEDQETILKFSKCLMECSVITVREVQAAITEACGQDIAAMEVPRQFTVAETPPALRSLHSEVRRLQAALDAERFDRNYLQEELARTNTRLERLLKEKEQHKFDILALKAKISLCCGEDTDARIADVASDNAAKLMRQLHQLEQRLEETQAQLHDMGCERDAYKAKMDELKHERDKWLAISQQENARVSQLSDELETERCHIQSLKDLVAELRQHNKLNGLDSSSLECDDPDASIHSLPHNLSTCSEVCANVVEVQLGEERAKIVVLKQQIQNLQDQINELNHNRETEKMTLENVIAQKENVIFSLKHRINEEIEERNNLKSHCDNEMTKLNNDINEYEQKLIESNKHSRSIIDRNMVDIQTLQEEKMSLLHSLDNETTKQENIIKDLKSEIDSERQARSNMKERYENHLMKLNEKVLNRNNELVELQNIIVEKGEKIETLQIELRQEKEASNELMTKYQNLNEQKNTIENDLRHKYDEVQNLHIKMQHNSTVIEDLNMEIEQLKTSVSSLNEKCKILEDVKEQLSNEIQNRDKKIVEAYKDIEHIGNVFQQQKDAFLQDMDEKNATVTSLQIQLQNEIQFKVELQNELNQLQNAKITLTEEFQKINSDLKNEIEDKDRTINAMDLYIHEQKQCNDQANEKIQKLSDNIIFKENDIKMLNNKLESATKSLQDEIQKSQDNTEVARNKLLAEIGEREILQLQLNTMMVEKSHIEKDLSVKCEEILMLRDECEELSQKLDENESHMQFLEQKFNDERMKCNDLNSTFITEMTLIKTKVTKMQNAVIEATKIMENKIKEKESLLHKLGNDLEIIKNVYERTTNSLQKTQDEKEVLVSKLNEEMSFKRKLEEVYEKQIAQFENLTIRFKDEIEAKNTKIDSLKVDIQSLLKTIDEKSGSLKVLEEQLQLESQSKRELSCHKEMEIEELRIELAELQSMKEKMKLDFSKEIEIKKQVIQALERDNEQLHFNIEEDNSSHEIVIKEKDTIIYILEQQIQENIIKFEDLRQYNEELKTSWENYKAEAKAAIREKEDKIAQLNEMALSFEQKINEVEQEKGELSKRIVEIKDSKKTKLKMLATKQKALKNMLESEKEVVAKENQVLLMKNENLLAAKAALTQELAEERAVSIIIKNENTMLFSEKEKLIQEKAILAQELAEERSVKNIAEEEKNILLAEKIEIKKQLNEEISTTKTLLREKDCLTQQLIEEKSTKEITEKEKELLIAEKDLLDERFNENEKIKSELCQEINILNRQIEVLLQDLAKEKEALFNMSEENKKLNDEFDKQKSFNKHLLEENQDLVSESDQLKKDLFNANSAHEILLSEKESLEMALHSEKSSRDEIETEKNNLAVKLEVELINKEEEYKILIEEFEKLKELFKASKEEQAALIKEKEWLLLDMRTAQEVLEAEKESVDKALNAEKSIRDQLHSEKNAMAIKFELELMNKEEEKKTLLIENENLKADLVKVVAEKESLVMSLGIEKSARDEVETEKKDLVIKVEELTHRLDKYEDVCSEYACDVDKKNREGKRFEAELKKLEANHQYLQEINTKLSTALSYSFDKLVQKFKIENISNDHLQKIIGDKEFKEMPLADVCDLVFEIADVLASEVSVLKKLNVSLERENAAYSEIQETLNQKEIQVFELQTEIKQLKQIVNENKIELTKQSETYATSMNSKIKDIQTLQQDNQMLHNDLNDVKVQLEVKVHSLKEKLIDNENLTDKLKNSYECQIDNLNVMITKLTNYLKEKTMELEAVRKDKELLQQTVGDSCQVIKTLEDEVKTEKQNIDKLMSGFESERQVLKNMVTVTESVMEDIKLSLNNAIAEHLTANNCLQVEKNELKLLLNDLEMKLRAQEMANTSLVSLLRVERKMKQAVEKESESIREYFDEVISYVSKERNTNISVISALEFQERILAGDYEKMKSDLENGQKVNNKLKLTMNALENELQSQEGKLEKVLQEKSQVENELKNVLDEKSQLEKSLQERAQNLTIVHLEIKELKDQLVGLFNEKNNLEFEKKQSFAKIEEFKAKVDSSELKLKEEIVNLKNENQQLLSTIEENRIVITNLEQLIKHELEENHKLRDNNEHANLIMANKCTMLQDYQTKAKKELEERQNEIITLRKEVETLQGRVELCEQDSKAKDGLISKMSKEKDAVISTISKELVEEKALKDKYEKELQAQKSIVNELRNNMEIRALKKENEQLIRAIGQQETFTALCQEKVAEKYACHPEPHDHHQVDNSSSDNTHSSVESLKTITDLEKIINDKNRTITTLQTDITYLKTLMAESETKLLDVNKELEVSKENCQQLSNQLKKIVYQKNEEIADLKKQVSKMSVTENRASQIIKVSAKYQAMILKRIAEIKSNTVLKELTNFGNSNNCDNELRRSLNAGTITMEDLENFLETTDRHLKRCSEKQIALQKERDRLIEVNRINESEIINLKKFLTELSVSFQTFNSVKDLYGQKLSRVISVQRTVRREILNLDGRITDAVMCKLERGYGAAMQDLSECTMNLERWVERCISRTVSVEKIKQAFTSDSERSSLATPSFQNTGLEIQLEELEKSFQKLLEEVARAARGEGAVESQASTVMEVRAEYEDKLNRMKAKMKDLFNEQMSVLKNKQREEIALLERELQKTRDRMEDSKRAYEAHIRELTKELWSVGEKYLVKNDEAEWLRKKQRSGSLMSLQHVHSSGLVPPQELPSRPSDAASLRSLPVVDTNTKNKKREGRGLHMSDEEGEVFDNRCLKELSATPRRDAPPGQRLSELKWRNSLCPPHLKSSYPAETQFAPVLDEEEIKAVAMGPVGGRPQRKEVGITAYKKPGPPTPSKQAGRLSATDSELRESLRVDNDPHAHSERKTSTPARFRAFLRFNKNDTNEGTPRARRLSNIFRKK